MKKKEIIPHERDKTIRQEILHLLNGRKIPIGTLSKEIRKSEKEIYDHLEQLKRSGLLKIIPAKCCSCDYIFETREKIKKPGKCPKCKSTFIEQPLFSTLPS